MKGIKIIFKVLNLKKELEKRGKEYKSPIGQKENIL